MSNQELEKIKKEYDENTKNHEFKSQNHKIKIEDYENQYLSYFKDKKNIDFELEICNEFCETNNESLLIYEKFIKEV